MGLADWIIDDTCIVSFGKAWLNLVSLQDWTLFLFSQILHRTKKLAINPARICYRAVLVVNKRKVTKKFITYTQL